MNLRILEVLLLIELERIVTLVLDTGRQKSTLFISRVKLPTLGLCQVCDLELLRGRGPSLGLHLGLLRWAVLREGCGRLRLSKLLRGPKERFLWLGKCILPYFLTLNGVEVNPCHAFTIVRAGVLPVSSFSFPSTLCLLIPLYIFWLKGLLEGTGVVSDA